MPAMNTTKWPLWTCLFLVAAVGCSGPPPVAKKAPRPVTVMKLTMSEPESIREVAGSVVSWKTEQIGFEVSGRVRWVLEPGADIEGRIFDTEGSQVTQGVALAQLDDERFQLAVQSAEAQVEVAKLQQESLQIEFTDGLPARKEAAAAELELARIEYERYKKLGAANVTAQADLDRATAEFKTAAANRLLLDAETSQTQAKIKSAAASLLQAQQALKDAQRNLADTTLYSSYRGQVAELHVAPGSVVSQGAPVLTVQMMDPIKVEVELSAEQSRVIQPKSNLPVKLSLPDGSKRLINGHVYMIDPTADPITRTFTLTLLILNEKLQSTPPAELANQEIARTTDIWPLDFDFLPDTPDGVFYVEQQSIRQDAEGAYLWRIKNRKAHEPVNNNPLLQVEKVRITAGDSLVPFLGNWTFRTFTSTDASLNPTEDMFIGAVDPPSGDPNDWNGEQVLLDFGEQWMLRPGDVVRVDLSGQSTAPGYFVPMNAIYEDAGATYLFLLDDSSSPAVAKKVQVQLAPQRDDTPGSLRRVLPPADMPTDPPPRIIVDGVHFLADGEQVLVSKKAGESR